MKAIKGSSTSYKLTACFLVCYNVILESILSQIGSTFMLVVGFHTSKHPSYRVNPSNVTAAEISIRLQIIDQIYSVKSKPLTKKRKKKSENTKFFT